jgi:hypothetical protein
MYYIHVYIYVEYLDIGPNPAPRFDGFINLKTQGRFPKISCLRIQTSASFGIEVSTCIQQFGTWTDSYLGIGPDISPNKLRHVSDAKMRWIHSMSSWQSLLPRILVCSQITPWMACRHSSHIFQLPLLQWFLLSTVMNGCSSLAEKCRLINHKMVCLKMNKQKNMVYHNFHH